MWSAQARVAPEHVRDEGSVSYTAVMESAATLDTEEVPSAFTRRVLREASRRRFVEAQRMVVLGDGAAWLPGPDRLRAVRRHADNCPDARKARFLEASSRREESGLTYFTSPSGPAPEETAARANL